jgi:hypothetical protein
MMTQLLSRSLGAALLAGVSCSATPTNAADPVLQWNKKCIGFTSIFTLSPSDATVTRTDRSDPRANDRPRRQEVVNPRRGGDD